MPYTVMLVDNEAIIPRGLMCLIDWKAHNCCVRAIANDGVDAVHQIQESPPDILITDIRMPEMDGLQLCGWVREHYPGIQMILLTGFPDFEYAQQAIQCGVTDFVLKPTTEKALSAAVDKACQRLQKESRVQKSLLLEQQALLGELIFQSRHSLLYILNKLNDLHIVLPSYYVLSLEVVFRGTLEECTAMLQQAQEVILSCCEGHTVFLVPKSDTCCYAVLSLPEGIDPAELCTSAVEAVEGKTDFLLTIGISRLHKNPLNIVNIRHGVLHRAHCDRETTAGKLCHRQMLLAAGFHRIGNQLFHFLPAADQRNACVMDGSDEVAAVIADVKLCLHIEILHRNVIGVFLVSI